MIFGILDNLRAKPEPVRRQIAVVLTICAMSIVVVLWWSFAGPSKILFSDGDSQGSSVSESLSPFRVLFEQGKVLYENTSGSFGEARGVFRSEGAPGATLEPALVPSSAGVGTNEGTYTVPFPEYTGDGQ